ncbi:hypothetical protein PF010_g10279 [Phytophthora fragariae]|uniref:Uncharacterized protein n=1 Tax=Phytophthora fragariae TaxID=53985 RepID=A0A6G0L9L2_9STRA|nr:hypothetical protein PF010_g10279 [Phytophthora fragariae]KAE9265892.1 hypothetical protein PF008_g31746 [Phytophthora fragariae]
MSDDEDKLLRLLVGKYIKKGNPMGSKVHDTGRMLAQLAFWCDMREALAANGATMGCVTVLRGGGHVRPRRLHGRRAAASCGGHVPAQAAHAHTITAKWGGPRRSPPLSEDAACMIAPWKR